MASGTIDGLKSSGKVTFTFTNLGTADIYFYKLQNFVVATVTVSISASATFQAGTVISSSGTIPTEFLPAEQCGCLCSRTDVANEAEASNGGGLKSMSCLRLMQDGTVGLGMINAIIKGVALVGTLCYVAA